VHQHNVEFFKVSVTSLPLPRCGPFPKGPCLGRPQRACSACCWWWC